MNNQSAFTAADVSHVGRREHTERLYDDIRREYKALASVKKHHVRLYTDEYIFAELSRRFYRSPATIQNILFGRV